MPELVRLAAEAACHRLRCSGSFCRGRRRRQQRGERLLESLFRHRQAQPVLRPARTGDARLDAAQIEFEGVGELRVDRFGGMKKPLLFHIGLDQRDPLRRPAGETQVIEGDPIDGEDGAGRSVFRRHVADGGAVGEPQTGDAGSEEFDEFADHPLAPQHLGDGKDQVGGRRPLPQLSLQAKTDHLRDEHRNRLAEHRRFRLDAADPPAEYPQTVDHRRVRIGADQRVGIRLRSAVALLPRPVADQPEHDPRQKFQVHLVTDAGVRWRDLEVVKGFLPPLQEGVTLPVALVIHLFVGGEGLRRGEGIDLD